jgi:hypothetical protein
VDNRTGVRFNTRQHPRVPTERPGPAFIALRAATLGIDDVSRQALRGWMFNGMDHRGTVAPDHPPPTEAATTVIVAGVLKLVPRERVAYRQWLGHWTDYTGRIITPDEHARRLKGIGLPPQREPQKRGRRP